MSKSLKGRSLVDTLVLWNRRHRQIIRFCLLLSLYTVLAFLLIHTIRARTDLLDLLSMKVALISSRILSLIGMKTEVVQTVVFQEKGFAIDISYKCTGVLQMAFISAGMFAFPCSWKKTLSGLAVAIPLLFVINTVRIVSLFVIGTFALSMFDFLHDIFSEIVMIIVTFLIWWFWLKYMR